MSNAIGATGEGTNRQLELLNLKVLPQNPPKRRRSRMFTRKQKGMESSVSNFSGNDHFAKLGAEAGWENFATCCKLLSIEITAIQMDVRTATVSTNMMFFTGTREDESRSMEFPIFAGRG